MDQPHALRPLLVPCVVVGVYVIVVTMLKDAQSIWPLQPGSANWRFGALGFFLGMGPLPVLGLALIALAAGLGEYKGLGLAVGVVGVVMAVSVIAALVVFVLDARTLLAAAGAGDAQAAIGGALRLTVALAVFTGPAYLAVGWAAWRTAGAIDSMKEAAKSGLIVGKQAG